MTFVIYLQKPCGKRANPANHTRVIVIDMPKATPDEPDEITAGAARLLARQTNWDWPITRVDHVPVHYSFTVRN